MDGQVVGIVTAILNPTKQGTFIGIGFAVPIENAAHGRRHATFLKRINQQLKENKKRGIDHG